MLRAPRRSSPVLDATERFAADTREHELHVLHDDGLYRHLRCKRPDDYFYGFDIVTWPGYLAYVGDMGDYLFSRVRDMFEFFASGTSLYEHRINPSYWAEKIQGGGERPAESFSERAYQRVVHEWRDEVISDTLLARYATDCEHFDAWLGLGCTRPYGGKLALSWSLGAADLDVVPFADLAKIDDFRSEVDWQLLRHDVYSEEMAYRLLDGFEWCGAYNEQPVEIEEAWELGSFREFDFRFIWACHAIVWAIARYRAL